MYISAVGMATSCLDVKNSCAAARAGISKLSPLSIMLADPAEIEPVSLCGYKHPFLSGFHGVSRLAQLTFRALKDLAANLPPNRKIPSKLILQLPHSSARPDLEKQVFNAEKDCRSQFLDALINCIRCETALSMIDVDAIEIFIGESAEFVFGFKSAYDYFAESGQMDCIVGSVDTLLGEMTIEYYLGRGQIVTPDSGYGFLPGEAAALLLVSNRADKSVCVLSSVDYAQEEYELFQSESEQNEESNDKSELGSQTFFHGRQYGALIKKVLRVAGLTDKNWDISEGYNEFPSSENRAQEWGNCLVILKESFPNIDSIEWKQSELSFGGIGVASIPVSICMGLHSFQREYAKNNSIVICSASDTGGRGALIITNSRVG